MKTYLCHKCDRILSIDHFHKDNDFKNNRKGHKSICKDCIAKNRDVARELLANAKKRAKKRNLEFNLTLEFIKQLNEKQNGKCSYSGIDLNWIISKSVKQRICPPDRVSLDRIDSSKGYIKENVQLVTDFVNRIKTWYPGDDFISFCQLVIDNIKK